MKYVDEFRDAVAVQNWANELQKVAKQSWTLMEICGGQTHNIMKFGLDRLLPKSIRLIHGPGCPVCVTPIAMIDAAVSIANQPNTIVCSFGDMLRVPGSEGSLLSARTAGADIRVVYSPKDAVRIAEHESNKEVIFFAVGFETTAPANAAAILESIRLGLKNFSMIVSHVLVPPAMEAILASPDHSVQGFLAAGHVCTVTGYEDYHQLALKHKTPIVVTGFEPLDILQGIYMCIEQLELGKAHVVNQYHRSVHPTGNQAARAAMSEVFETCDREWRGIGSIAQSGYRLRSHLSHFNALKRFQVIEASHKEDSECKAGAILKGKIKPYECSAFGVRCRPESPKGAPMVSNEGACAAYYFYKTRSEVDA